MDFTYIFAVVIAFAVGLAAQVWRFLARNRWSRTSGLISVGCALAANGFLLLNWSHFLDWGAVFAAVDLSIIFLMTLIGFGAVAPGAIMAVFRK